MHGQVLAGLDELVLFPIQLEAAALGVPGGGIRELVVADHFRRGPRVHQRRNPLPRFRFEIGEPVALGVGGGIEDALQVDVGAPLAHELPHVVEALVAGLLRQLRRHQREHLDVADGVEDALERRPRKDDEERVGHRRRHVGMLQLRPRIDTKHHVGPLAGSRPPPLLHGDHLDARQGVDHRVVVPLHVAEDRVGIGEPHDLGRRRHVGRAGQQPVADAQRMVLVVVVVRRLRPPVLPRPRGLRGIELEVERVLVDVLRRAVEERRAVVAGVGADVPAHAPDIAGQRREQEDVAVLVVVVEELVRSHPNREERRPRLLRDVPGQPLDGGRRRPRELLGRLRIEVRGVFLDEVEHGTAANGLAVCERHLHAAFELGIARHRLGADLVARNRPGLPGGAVPEHVVAPVVAHGLGHELAVVRQRWRRRFADLEHPRGLETRGGAAEHVLRPQVLQRVGAHQQREVGPALHVVHVVEPVPDDHVREAERQRRRRARPHDDDVVSLARGRRVLAGDDNDARAFQPGLGQPVRVGHLGADPVHAPDDDRLRVLDGGQVEFDRLLARHHRVSRWQVGVPRVVVEAA